MTIVQTHKETFVSFISGKDKARDFGIYWFARLAESDENKYLEDNKFTPKAVFWNTTLGGKLLPFILKATKELIKWIHD